MAETTLQAQADPASEQHDSSKGGETRVYHLSCHCQAHILRLTTSDHLTGLGVCDCSHCLKRRIIWKPTPPGTLEAVRGFGTDGKEDLKEYRMGSGSGGHQFCGICGTHILGSKFDPSQEMYLNVRTVRDQDVNIMHQPFDLYSGIDRPPPYTHIKLSDVPGAGDYLSARAKRLNYPCTILAGSCHCQKVKFGVLCKPYKDEQFVDCGCSICVGNGVFWLYPDRQDIFFHPSLSASEPHQLAPGLLTEYTFHKKQNVHYFCPTCGCNVMEYTDPKHKDAIPAGESYQVDEEDNGWDGCGVNAALLTGIGMYLGDVHGLKDEQRWHESMAVGKEGKEGLGFEKLGKVLRYPDDKDKEPVYKLAL